MLPSSASHTLGTFPKGKGLLHNLFETVGADAFIGPILAFVHPSADRPEAGPYRAVFGLCGFRRTVEDAGPYRAGFGLYWFWRAESASHTLGTFPQGEGLLHTRFETVGADAFIGPILAFVQPLADRRGRRSLQGWLWIVRVLAGRCGHRPLRG